ncbi:uncharacterized protein Tco025E_00483 [Trypanosoma conorhini]|uniref:Uncharacterized protein n=1 Tax=Trypanosoma conorhini TaxID=83891 RepID=A0A422QBD2_9TRYP|nr:uncharacterized protein Tco025E_00483 [Trypanosoma conorhini]RNF27292.1 hypothetical protein Tco025E_00483 [Trypanosoma conorhini]
MHRGAYQVRFYDSSDDEQNVRVAEVMPVVDDPQPLPEAASSRQQQQQQQPPSWIRRAVDSAVTCVASALTTQSGAPASTQLTIARASSSSSNDSGDWGYRGYCRSPFHEETPPPNDSLDRSEDIAVDLREVILQYRRTPNDVCKRIILAALDFREVQINGDVFRAAAGNSELIGTLLRSGRVNFDDPDVQEVIQEEIDSALRVDRADRVRTYPDKIGYLRLLCRVRSATLTQEQARQCRQSGFEYAKLLYDNPHLLRNIPPPSWFVARILDFFSILVMVITWLGLAATLLNFVSVGWLASIWFRSNHPSFGYWTILCYVAGYVGSIVVVMTSEEGRIRDYDDRLWDYPDNSLKVVPCVPFFEIALLYVTLRYELLRDKAKYFVIRHDLYNGLSNVLIINTYLFATPQLLLQFYLSSLHDPDTKELAAYGLLACVNYTLYGMSMCLFMWNIFFQYSCNSFGFAVMAVKQALLMPIDVTTRTLIVTALFYLECNVVACVMSLSDIYKCSWETIVFIAVLVTLIVIVIIGFVLVILLGAIRHIWAVCLLSILLQVVFSIYAVGNASEDQEVCRLLAISTSVVPPFTYVAYAAFCVTFLAWVAVALHGKVTGRQSYLRWDNHFYWSCGR